VQSCPERTAQYLMKSSLCYLSVLRDWAVLFAESKRTMIAHYDKAVLIGVYYDSLRQG